jgi:imidazole glycerol-phosphate synthase subunit HisH
MIDLIDYGGGNTGSIVRALERLGAKHAFVSSPEKLSGRNPIILPGVGTFGAVMKSIEPVKMPLIKAIETGTPFLGICVGLQILFEESAESPGVPGLGILKGRVVRFKNGKVPQIGWNRIEPAACSGFEPGHVYFVNSYYSVPADQKDVLYTADYFGLFCAAVRRRNVTAFQFHPEKSGEFGHSLMRRWLDAL